MKYERHCNLTFKRFGNTHADVHKDLDQDQSFAGMPHRQHRHHLEYMLDKYHRGEWDIEELRAGIHHMIDDCGIIMVKADWNLDNNIIGQCVNCRSKNLRFSNTEPATICNDCGQIEKWSIVTNGDDEHNE